MHLSSVRDWIRQVYVTQDEELDCDGLFGAIPQYVDAEVVGDDADEILPDVRHHLRQCFECYDLYLTLRDVARLEREQVSPQAANLQRS